MELLFFHERFLGKPLVFCGTGGLIPNRIKGRPSHLKSVTPGDVIVMVGGRIGKDGIHGATFSSEALQEGFTCHCGTKSAILSFNGVCMISF